MATCSAYAISSFLHIDTNSLAQNPKVQPQHQQPFRPSFAPQGTFQFLDNMITTDSNNTISFQDGVYSLNNDIQFCTPTVHMAGSQVTNAAGRGVYTSNGQPVAADLMLTFVNPTAANTSPKVILVILPIYVTTAQEPNFLSTLIQQKSTVGSLSSLFNENSKSYGYNICISTVENAENLRINNGIGVYVVSIPSGYSMPQTDINQLANLQEYTFRPANGHPIVTAFGFDSETDTYPPKQIDAGTFYCIYIAGNDEKVSNNVTIYALPPMDNQAQWKSAQFTLDQYKCYPLNELQNLKDASPNVVTMQDAIKSMESASPDNSGFSTGLMWALWVLLGLTIIGTLFILISYFVTPDEVPINDLIAAAPSVSPT